MSLLNIPTQEAQAQFRNEQSQLAPIEQIGAEPEGRNLEYIGKQIFNAFDNMSKASALFIGSALEQAGASGGGYFMEQTVRPSPVTLPSPEHLNVAGQTVGDVANTLVPFFAGLPIGVATIGATTGISDINAGVDVATAQKHASVVAGGAAAMAGLGMAVGSGKTLIGTIGKQTAANIPTGIAQRGIEKATLSDYPEIAEQIKVLGGKELFLDTALGVLFGGMSHKKAVAKVMETHGVDESTATKAVTVAEDVISRDVVVDDAVRTNQMHEAVKEINPLIDADYDRHVAAIDKAMLDIEEGRMVDLTDIVDDAVQLKPEAVEQVKAMVAVADEARPFEQVKQDANLSSFEIKDTGEYILLKSERGQVGGVVDGDTLRINSADLASGETKGVGTGQKLYAELFEYAQRKGISKITSDVTLENDAFHLWSALERKGLADRNPNAVPLEDGTGWYVKDGGLKEPVFTLKETPDPLVKLKRLDESGALVEKEMKSTEAMKVIEDEQGLLANILSCVRGE